MYVCLHRQAIWLVFFFFFCSARSMKVVPVFALWVLVGTLSMGVRGPSVVPVVVAHRPLFGWPWPGFSGLWLFSLSSTWSWCCFCPVQLSTLRGCCSHVPVILASRFPGCVARWAASQVCAGIAVRALHPFPARGHCSTVLFGEFRLPSDFCRPPALAVNCCSSLAATAKPSRRSLDYAPFCIALRRTTRSSRQTPAGGRHCGGQAPMV